MAYKKVGGFEIIDGRAGRFLRYCDHCGKKLILSSRDAKELVEAFGMKYYNSQKPVRRVIRKVLTWGLEKV